ncbi:MAG: PilZ domain-containing protein [Leptospiraceae bacterium]|nr:PilZ domain-containing protein [Leptospiraceae bacterium]MCZ8346326.1 PilZ domain-containing protein [Leptospiraceae bacterium]
MRTLRITPLPILIISFLFMLIPILSYLATADFYFLSIWQVRNVFSKMEYIQILVLVSSLFVSIGILFRKKAGYFAFFTLAGILILYNVWLLTSSFFGKSFHVAGFPLTRQDVVMNFSLTLFLLGSIYYFLNQEISAPYFSPDSRGWRRNPRETIPLSFQLKFQSSTFAGKTINLSKSGAMVPVIKSFEFEPGEEGEVEIVFEDRDGRDFKGVFRCMLIRIDEIDFLPGEKQIGLRFLSDSTTKESKIQLSYFLEERYSPRYVVSTQVQFGDRGFEEYKNQLANISAEGLYLNTNIHYPTGKDIYIRIPTLSGNIDLEARVSWSNPKGEFGKQQGFGVQIVLNRNPIRFHIWLLRVRTQKLHTR